MARHPAGHGHARASDPDLLVVLDHKATDAELAAAKAMETAIDSPFSQIDGVGMVHQILPRATRQV